MIGKLHNLFRGHVPDGDLTLLVTGDLPSHKQTRVEQHLEACGRCRARCGRFEALFLQVMAYHSYQAESDRQDDRARRFRLATRLEQMPEYGPDTNVAKSQRPKHRVGALVSMNPILVTGLMLAVASITCVFLWIQQSRPNITSNMLLVRAGAWDPGAARNSVPAVIRQTVKITTGKQSLSRTIYRDAEARRKPRHPQRTEDDILLALKLAQADVAWDAPLSATGYQDWHDAQRVREDQIQRAAGDLLVLTTTTPNGAVAAQSLTVRGTDFHPVRRTVSFRDSATVEIAELDYAVLPWTPEVSRLFETEDGMRLAGATRPSPTLVPLPPLPLTEEQLNEAELSTRLTLNRLHADTGEQVEVARGPLGIEVRGITDTEERKHELELELFQLPHVTAYLSSIEKLKAKPSERDELSSLKVVEMQTQTTPLETYCLAHGCSVAPVGDLAQRLFNIAFSIHLESTAIDDLQHRFVHDEEISKIASATLTDLLFTHKHKLLSALEDEERLLADAQIEAPRSKELASRNSPDVALAALAAQNLALIKELALSKGGGGRSAETIAAELAASMSQLNSQAHAIQVAPQNSTKPDKRK